jgi:hypothetical protein
MNMPRKLCLLLCLAVSLAVSLVLLAPPGAQAGRIGFKNNHPKHCFAFKFQTMKWDDDQKKWEPLSEPKFKYVKPGETQIYEGFTDAINWISYAETEDVKCWTPSETGYLRIWWTGQPTARGTLNVIVDTQGDVTVTKIR